MGIMQVQIQKALQPLMKQQRENFEKINEKYDDLKTKVKLYVADEVKRQLEEAKEKKENVKKDTEMVK